MFGGVANGWQKLFSRFFIVYYVYSNYLMCYQTWPNLTFLVEVWE